MGLLGNGDDSLTSNTGWGMMRPMNSGADWGSASSSSSIGANTGSSHQTMSASSSTNCWQTSTTSTSNNIINSGGGARGGTSQMVSSNSASTSNNEQHHNQQQQALSSSPKLSSSWAQAAGKGLMASSSSNSSNNNNNNNSTGNSQANPNSNVIIHQSSSNNSNTGSVSSVSDRQSNNNNGPNATTTSSMSGAINNYSHESYSAAINSGSNNNQTLNSKGTTGSSCSSSSQAFQSQAQPSGANNSSSTSEPYGGNGGNKRAIATTNIQDIIANLSEDVRETLLTEKWRSPVINHDSPWNLPPSPQSSPKDTSQWRCPSNSGTEIWESAVRQKKGGSGGPPMASGGGVGVNNLGGNVMMANNGANNALSSNTPNVGMHGSIGQMNGPSMSSNTSSSQPWGQPTNTGSIGGNWGEEEDTTNHWAPQMPSINSVCASECPSVNDIGGGGPGGNSSLSSINNWSSNGPNVSSSFNNNWNNSSNMDNAVKGFDANNKPGPRKTWGNSFDTTDSAHEPNWDRQNENFGTWNPESNKKESGWDKESNDSFKGHVDDGTAVWGNPVRQTKVSNWKDSKFGNNSANNNNKNGFNNGWNKGAAGMNNVNGWASSPIGPNGNQQKSNPMASRSWSTDGSQQRKSPSSWNDCDNGVNKVNGNSSPSPHWIDSNSSLIWLGPNKNAAKQNNNKGHGSNIAGGGGAGAAGMVQPNNWMDSQVDNNLCNAVNNVLPNKQTGGALAGSAIGGGAGGSNQKMMQPTNNSFKNMGFKKEEMDNLRNNQMRPDDALNFKNQFDDDLSRRTASQCALSNGRSRMDSFMNAPNTFVPSSANNGAMLNNATRQVLNFGVSCGFLEPQILTLLSTTNPQNLDILNHLAQQLKLLRMFSNRYDVNSLQKFSQLKQSIITLKEQLHYPTTATAATPNSQFSMQSGGGRANVPTLSAQANPNSIEFFKQNVSAAENGNVVNSTGNDFSSGFNFVQTPQTQGSRLHSWKSQNSKPDVASNDFIRAPGPLSKQNSTGSNNNWGGFGGSADDPNWTGAADKSELPMLDDFDDFDCHKTWKNSGAKTLDDDPRSPLFNLSKDSFPWNSNKPSTLLSANSDSTFAPFPTPTNSNPWSFNPVISAQSSTATSNMFDMSQQASSNKTVGPKNKMNTWGNALNANAADYNINSDSLWPDGNNSANTNKNSFNGWNTANVGQQDNNTGTGTGNKSRPPPGLSGKISNQNSSSANSNVWSSGLANTASNSCEYLRLRNLTPQIDGSTLRTLCLQHGPLNQFHLNNGVAIVRYTTREQAIKAQAALNNCILGNTTIIADLPSQNEIQQYTNAVVSNVTTMAPQQQQSNINSLAISWSNGTSHTNQTVTVGACSATSGNNPSQTNLQSYQTNQQNVQTAAAVQRGQQQQSSYGGGNAGAATGLMGNSANAATNQNTLPYGSNGSVLSTHSSASLPFGSAAAAAANNSNKIDPSSGWNANTVGSMMWDLNNSSSTTAATNLWSSSGFSATDRATPIQNLLPNDLLAGENN